MIASEEFGNSHRPIDVVHEPLHRITLVDRRPHGIPNFKHPGACLEGSERSQEALRGLEEPTVCTKKVLDSGGWRLALAGGAL